MALQDLAKLRGTALGQLCEAEVETGGRPATLYYVPTTLSESEVIKLYEQQELPAEAEAYRQFLVSKTLRVPVQEGAT